MSHTDQQPSPPSHPPRLCLSTCRSFPQTCTGDKDQATFNLKLALKLSGELDGLRRHSLTLSVTSFAVHWLRGCVPHLRKSTAPYPPPPCHASPCSMHGHAAGQGGVLAQEVDQLKRMLKAGANWEVISQMMSYISDKAAQVETMAADMAAGGSDATPQSKPMFGMLGGKSSKVPPGLKLLLLLPAMPPLCRRQCTVFMPGCHLVAACSPMSLAAPARLPTAACLACACEWCSR